MKTIAGDKISGFQPRLCDRFIEQPELNCLTYLLLIPCLWSEGIKPYLPVASLTVLVDSLLCGAFGTQHLVMLQWSVALLRHERTQRGIGPGLALQMLLASPSHPAMGTGDLDPCQCMPIAVEHGLNCRVPQQGDSPKWAPLLASAEGQVLGQPKENISLCHGLMCL